MMANPQVSNRQRVNQVVGLLQLPADGGGYLEELKPRSRKILSSKEWISRRFEFWSFSKNRSLEGGVMANPVALFDRV